MLLEELSNGLVPNEMDDLDIQAEAEFGMPVYESDINAQDQRVLAEEKRTGIHENFRDAMDRSLQMLDRPVAPMSSLGTVPGSDVPLPDMRQAGIVPGADVPLPDMQMASNTPIMPTGPGMRPMV